MKEMRRWIRRELPLALYYDFLYISRIISDGGYGIGVWLDKANINVKFHAFLS